MRGRDWLGSTVNQGMKILSKANGSENEEELVVTPAAFEQLTHDKIRLSCGCNADGKRSALWTEVPTEDLAPIGIDRIYRLKSLWCVVHGDEFFRAIAADCGITMATGCA